MRRSIQYALLFLLAINVAVVGRLAYTQLQSDKSDTVLCAKRAADLGLDDAQTTQMGQLRTIYQGKKEDQWRAQARIQARLISLLEAESPDTTAIGAAVDTLNALHAELQHLAIQQLLKEKALLSPAQQAAFIATLKQCHNQACLNALGANACPAAKISTCQNSHSSHPPTGGNTP